MEKTISILFILFGVITILFRNIVAQFFHKISFWTYSRPIPVTQYLLLAWLQGLLLIFWGLSKLIELGVF